LAAPGEPSEGILILPNRRSARAVAGAFLQANNGKALLLPRIIAVGAIDEAGLAVNQNLRLQPAVPPITRQALLSKLILARNGKNGAPTKLGLAWRLAADLAALLDEADRVEINLGDALRHLVTGDLASHWQITLEFLEIVTDAWPAILDELGMLNPVNRQNLLINAQSESWIRSPPKTKIWMVARDASPALQRLAKTIATLRQGAVILPGYDHIMSEVAWNSIEDTHPQKSIDILLSALGARHDEIEIWPAAESKVPAGRVSLTSMALLPASCLGEWQGSTISPTDGICKLVPRDEHEEAVAIAMALREALEIPDQSAALITPDRGLALRVRAHLHRFGIIADDSGGETLAETPPAIFLRLLARAASEAFSPLPLLSLLKHPLMANGEPSEICREHARVLEISALRGPRPAPGLSGIKFKLDQVDDKSSAVFVDRLEVNLKPIISLSISVNPAEALHALIMTSENLCASATEAGASRLWRDEAGAALSELLESILPAVEDLPDIALPELCPFLDSILAEHVVRRPRTKDGHPRVAIWGIQEASLQTVDVVVLGGLVEGVWPDTADPGPWMSRPMRKKAGLASAERKIGNAANDFFSLCCQTPVIVFAAAKRRGRAPTVPARWLTRLDALLNGRQMRLATHEAASWAAQIDHAKDRLLRPKPTPRPPAIFRPTKFSITDIATLINDPYAIYLTKILRFQKLKDLDEESDSGLFGNIVHAGLATFFSAEPDIRSKQATEQLILALRRAMRAERPRAGLENWWDARLQRIAKWVIVSERERRDKYGDPASLALERRGILSIADKFTLIGRADRIERRTDKSIMIMDYKTGTAPDAKTLRSGTAPQLPLEAMMAEAGAFGESFTGQVTELAVWKLAGGRIEGKDIVLAQNPEDLQSIICQAAEKLPVLLDKFANPRIPYLARPHPDRSIGLDIFQGISRISEWLDENETNEISG
jgi:ATP-dependent helicase/nuclease subunit B